METATRTVSSDAESLILVDADDQPIGKLSKANAHDGDGILHRAFSVFLFNEDGDLLLQRRSSGKRLWPGYWSNTCCSHPRVGESLEVATRRRLDDELNLTADLEHVYRFQYQANFKDLGAENELCHVFLGRCGDSISPNRSEISEIRFLPARDVAGELDRRPDDYTPWFKLEWKRLVEDYSNRLSAYADVT